MIRIDPSHWVAVDADSLYSYPGFLISSVDLNKMLMRISGYALFRVGNKTLAEELIQETFISALAARSGFLGKASEKTWFFSILKNKIYDLLRRKYKETSVSSEYLFSTFIVKIIYVRIILFVRL